MQAESDGGERTQERLAGTVQQTLSFVDVIAEAESLEGVPEVRVSAPLGPGVLGYVATSGRPLLLSDASIDQRFESRVDECAATLPDSAGPASCP